MRTPRTTPSRPGPRKPGHAETPVAAGAGAGVVAIPRAAAAGGAGFLPACASSRSSGVADQRQ
jgi:hypothetical protein